MRHMQLFDELFSALEDLPSNRQGAITRALSTLGIHVEQLGRGEGGVESQLFLNLDVYSKEECIWKPHTADYDIKNRRWRLPHVKNPVSSGETTSFQSKAEPLVRSKAGSSIHGQRAKGSDRHDDFSDDEDNQFENQSSNWTDLLPRTPHTEFLISRDWKSSELGPIEKWPAPLRFMTRKIFAEPKPANLYWGKSRVAIYNEHFVTLAGNRHPMMMGSTGEAALPLTWPFLGPVLAHVESSGVAFSMPEFEMTVEKQEGFIEEAWYDATFSPITDDNGTVLGLYNSGYEITSRVIPARCLEILHKLAATPNFHQMTVWSHIIDTCRPFDRDLPLLALYSASAHDNPEQPRCTLHLEGVLGFETIPGQFELYDPYAMETALISAFRSAKSTGDPMVLRTHEDGHPPLDFLEHVEHRGHPQAVTHLAIIPIFTAGSISAFVVAGLNPQRPYDDDHQKFVTDFAYIMTALLYSTVSFEQAKAREAQLNRELTQRERYIRTMAEVATAGIFDLSPNGTITWANSKYYEITNPSENPAHPGTSFLVDCLVEADAQEAWNAFNQCRVDHMGTTADLRIKKTWKPPESNDHEPRWVLVSYEPHINDGEFLSVLGCITDITHLKWAEQLQKSTAEKAVAARLHQERFIDLTSHELRNPLSAIVQCADDICRSAQRRLETESRGDLRELVDGMYESAQTILLCAGHQQRIVDDILTFSKLESSLLTITPVLSRPLAIVRQVAQMFKNEAAASDIDLSCSSDTSFSSLGLDLLYCDPTRLSQILINLVTNALKFTKTATFRKIEVCIGAGACISSTDFENNIAHSTGVKWFPSGVKRQGAVEFDHLGTGEVIYLVFSVRDTGKGISEEEMSKLFNRFSQANPKTHVQYGGSGLGLFLSRELTELQGGQIASTSVPGQGSIFAFYIKTTRATQAEVQEAQLVGTAGRPPSPELVRANNRKTSLTTASESKRSVPQPMNPPQQAQHEILVVEDNLINQKVISTQLRRAGFTVDVANHGAEALDFLRTTRHWRGNQGAEKSVSYILMDWEMPVMDGLTCTREIRRLENEGYFVDHIGIIATTANARPEQVKMAFDVGVDGFLAKPFKLDDVRKKMKELDSSLARITENKRPNP